MPHKRHPDKTQARHDAWCAKKALRFEEASAASSGPSVFEQVDAEMGDVDVHVPVQKRRRLPMVSSAQGSRPAQPLRLPRGWNVDTLPRCWCQLPSAPRVHVLVGCPQRGGVLGGKWREGAGVVALREVEGAMQALVVNGRTGSLGFPKGGREGAETAMENALREWRQETGLHEQYLVFYQGMVLAETSYGCHYFVARWTKPVEASDARSWGPPGEDPNDPDPIILVQWLPIAALLSHSQLSAPRKQLLKQAAQLASELPDPTAVEVPVPVQAPWHKQCRKWQRSREDVDRGGAHTRAQSSDAADPRKGTGKRKGKDRKDRGTTISLAMTHFLRHGADSRGVRPRADGYVPVRAMIGAKVFARLGVTESEVRCAVENCPKRRFQLSEENGAVLVRAAQGHSMKIVEDDALLHRLSAGDPKLPNICVHGTYRRFLQSIWQHGLLAGGGAGVNKERNHVHFSAYEPGDNRVISGMRGSCEIAIYLDLPAALAAGIPFFVSTNEVILTPGIDGVVPSKFIKEVRDLRSKQLLGPSFAGESPRSH